VGVISPSEALLSQAQSQLARQEAKLNSFRTTAGTVLATGGVVAGLVATRLTSRMSVWGYLFASVAVITFVGGVAASLMVLAPWKEYHFSEDLTSYQLWIEQEFENPNADVSFALGLAKNLNSNRASNEANLEEAANALAMSCILLAAQVASWVIAVLVA
jgi:hypothetical protein